MNCHEYRDLLSPFLDGELDFDQSEDVAGHLGICPGCRRSFDSLRDIAEICRDLPMLEPSTKAILRISSAIHPMDSTKRRTEFGPVMDLSDLAEFLRLEVSLLDPYLDEIPCFELAGKLLFRRKSVEEWIGGRERGFGAQRDEGHGTRMMPLKVLPSGGDRWPRQ